MTIFYEDTMPYGQQLFSRIGQSVAFQSGQLKPSDLVDASMLFVRSTTQVDEQLLACSRQLQLVGTGTSGTEHVDQSYLQRHQIPFVSAKGANAISVAEYVLSVIFNSAIDKNWDPFKRRVGIVGAGCVGTALAKRCESLGIACVLYDPPLSQTQDPRSFVEFDEILACDTISLHVPLTATGTDSTYHLFDQDRLSMLGEEQLLINAARGEVVDNQGLVNLFELGKKLNIVLDVWENEPHILAQLIPHLLYCTAHIAGHSIEGKANGTFMMYQKACEISQQPPTLVLSDLLPDFEQNPVKLSSVSSLTAEDIQQLINAVYDIRDDHQRFIERMSCSTDLGFDFRYYRKNYAIRREFSVQQVYTGKLRQSKALFGLGFEVISPL
jgi:erythronate-4-phosphate dehydrogenase